MIGVGCELLGAGETVIGQTEQFASDPDHRGLYMRRDESLVPPSRRSVLG